jgi:sulfoxide reductase heme-binding subunit YedZ
LIGVTALAYTIAHLFIYFALRFWNFTSIAHEMLTRVSLILATIGTIGLVALGATSLDDAIRRMGAANWQKLHNAIYVIGALAIIHYLLSPDIYPEQYLMSGIFCWLMLWRVLNRRGLGTNAGALTGITLVSCLFTALLEIGWIWAYQGYAVSEILNIYFSLDLGVPPALKILAIGALIALGAGVRHALRLKTANLGARKMYRRTGNNDIIPPRAT